MTNGRTDSADVRRATSVAALVVLVLVGACAGAEPGPTSPDDFGVTPCGQTAAVRLNQPIADVLGALGPPHEVRVSSNESDAKWDVLSYIYEDLWVAAYRGFPLVLSLWVRNGCWETPRGVRLGDSAAMVKAKYHDVRTLEGGNLAITLADPESIGGLAQLSFVFVIKDGRVTELVATIPEI